MAHPRAHFFLGAKSFALELGGHPSIAAHGGEEASVVVIHALIVLTERVLPPLLSFTLPKGWHWIDLAIVRPK